VYWGKGPRFWKNITSIIRVVDYAKQKTAHKQVPCRTIDPQHEGDMFLQNFGPFSDYKELYKRRPFCSELNYGDEINPWIKLIC
jgi:hypothetical protein